LPASRKRRHKHTKEPGGAHTTRQRVVVVVPGVLPIAPVELLASVLPVLPVAEPEAPMLVPLPVVLPAPAVASVEPAGLALVLGLVLLVEAELSALPEGAGAVDGVVVDVVLSVFVSRWQADSDSAAAAIRARAALRARGVVVIRTLLERL
jgi:hypothetical protein